MVILFPEPYKDELLYSVIARYHFNAVNPSLRDTLISLFDYGTVIPSIEFPSRLENLANKLKGSMYDYEYLLKYHTMLPYYSPFLPTNRYEAIMEEMRWGNGQGVYAKIGYQAGSVCRKRAFAYCPLCTKEDAEKYGDAYFHRIHQLQGIFVCPHHGCNLKEYPLYRHNVSKIEFIRFDTSLADMTPDYENNADLLLHQKNLAHAASWLGNNFPNSSDEFVYNKYQSLLAEKGLLSVNGSVRQAKLANQLLEFYGELLLDKMECNIEWAGEYNWLKTITRRYKKVAHPIRHLLLILFLSGSIENFFLQDTNLVNYFGAGPWLCLNPVAGHYKKPVIKDCRVTADYKTRKPVGTFACECGFVYATRGVIDSKRISIQCFGSVWEQKLKNEIMQGTVGLRKLARVMSCDPKTIIKYSNKLGLLHYLNTKSKPEESYSKIICNKSMIEQYREEMLEFVTENPTFSRTQIRAYLNKQYTFLYRHNKDLLYSILPLCILHSKRNNKENRRVDWRERDLQIKEEIMQVREEIIAHKPVKITKSKLFRATGKDSLIRTSLEKMPVTKKYLNLCGL